jgi:hypothetical protein
MRQSTTLSPPGGGTREDTPTTRSQEEQKQAETPATDDDMPVPADVTGILPSYLLQITTRDESINLEDVIEEAKEKGEGGDSDDEADDFLDHDAVMVEAIVERKEGTEDEEGIDDSDQHSVVLLKALGPVIDIKVPGTPDDWVPAERKEDKGQPACS